MYTLKREITSNKETVTHTLDFVKNSKGIGHWTTKPADMYGPTWAGRDAEFTLTGPAGTNVTFVLQAVGRDGFNTRRQIDQFNTVRKIIRDIDAGTRKNQDWTYRIGRHGEQAHAYETWEQLRARLLEEAATRLDRPAAPAKPVTETVTETATVFDKIREFAANILRREEIAN